MSVINFFDILGDVGGLYELLTIAAGILFKILFAFQMKRDLKRKSNKEESGDWFSYPALLNKNKSHNKKKRRRKVLNWEDMSKENTNDCWTSLYKEIRDKIISGKKEYLMKI